MSINYEAFTQLKRVLNESIEGKLNTTFDMDTFATVHKCGTAACAAGSAGLDSWFRSRGFKTVKSLGDISFRINKKTYYGISAAAEFFGIQYFESRELFDPYNYKKGSVSEQDVLNKLDKLIAAKKEIERVNDLAKAEHNKLIKDAEFCQMFLAEMQRSKKPLSEATEDLDEEQTAIIIAAITAWSKI